MASAFTHAVAGASLATLFTPDRPKLVALAAACAVLPDADALAFALGIPYEHMLGHRGLTHSIAFAMCVAALGTWAATRGDRRDIPVRRLAASLFFATVSHGVLDALTSGGLGVAFFAPFSGERYFFPWRPILVSPISIRRFFTARGWSILTNELYIVWLPALALGAAGAVARRALRSRRSV